MKRRAAIIGARGYVGAELVKILGDHPEVAIDYVTSRDREGHDVDIDGAPSGIRYASSDPDAAARAAADVYFLAVANGATDAYVLAIERECPAALVVDLSVDHRTDAAWAYGQPERNRAAIRASRRIANPGCYATAVQLAVDPFAAEALGPIVAFGVSGYSGAGTSPSPKNDPVVLKDNLLPYALVDHGHEPELAATLGRPVRLVPHVAPFFRGLSVTVSFTLGKESNLGRLSAQLLHRYAKEPMVTVSSQAPLVRDAAGTHGVFVGGASVAKDGTSAVVVATLDNLLGGAASQAVRNMNLALGFEENCAIPQGTP